MARENLGAAPTVNNDLVRKGDLDTALAGKVPLSATSMTNAAFAQASSNLVCTTTITDVPGATVTITTQVANTVVMVQGVFDFSAINMTAAHVGQGSLAVDGSTVANPKALYTGYTPGVANSNFRSTITQVWLVTLASAGSHTLKLQGSRNLDTGGTTYQIGQNHTTITVLGRF